MSMIDIIRNLMLEYKDNGKNKGFMIACFMFFVMKGIYYIIVKILKYASVLAGIGSIALVVAIYIKFNQVTMSYMGIPLITYIKLFSTKDIILCAIILLTVLVAVIMIVISLGIEWGEIATCLENGGSSQYINSCYNGINELEDLEISVSKLTERLSSAAENRINVMGQAQQIFEQYMGTKELEHTFKENNRFWLENIDKAGQYMELMSKEINEDKIIKLYWRIYYLVQGLEIVNKNVEDEIIKSQRQSSSKQYSRNEEAEKNGATEQRKSQAHELHFFMGCKDLNSLEERRKKLSKIYHPDTETGDTESFQVIMNEYERLKKTFPSNA